MANQSYLKAVIIFFYLILFLQQKQYFSFLFILTIALEAFFRATNIHSDTLIIHNFYVDINYNDIYDED